MPRCCSGASCSCVIEGGAHVAVVGVGSPADPFVVSADTGFKVTDTKTIDLTLLGVGTSGSPYDLRAGFAATAQLKDFPDVSDTAPTNGQVLAWNTAGNTWLPAAPTTAAAGAVQHDNSLAGDGSAGNVLQVKEDPARFLATVTAGLGMSDAGMNAMVRKYADLASRTATTPIPDVNTLSLVASNPGQIDYWTGASWAPAGQFTVSVTNALYEMSGPYTTQRVTLLVANGSVTTDSDGKYDVIASTVLAGRAGVLSAQVTPTASPLDATAIPWATSVGGESGALRGIAYRLDGGTVMPSSPVSFTVVAMLY